MTLEKEIEHYQDRIVDIERNVDPKTLNPHPYNFRIHQKPQIDTMDDIMNEIGVIDGIKASVKTRNVIDGHMRTKMFIEKNQLIPLVIWLDLENEEEERRAILLFDEIGKMARTDRKVLENIINETQMKKKNIQDLVESIAKKKQIDISIDRDTGEISAEMKSDDGDKEEMDQMFDNLIDKWDVSDGRVWLLDEGMYLIKGDTTKDETKEIVWEFKPDCILTDPPYGIDVVGSDGRIGLAKHFGDVGGDTAPFKANHILDYDLPSIIWGANHFSSQLPDFPRMLVWNKRGEGNKPNDFADAEIAWCSEKGVIRTFDHVWRGAARASEREVARMHPTQKPILVFEWCLEFFPNYHMPLDMYCGSGTIFLSSKNVGKGAIGVEYDARYVAVSMERYYNHIQRIRKPERIL